MDSAGSADRSGAMWLAAIDYRIVICHNLKSLYELEICVTTQIYGAYYRMRKLKFDMMLYGFGTDCWRVNVHYERKWRGCFSASDVSLHPNRACSRSKHCAYSSSDRPASCTHANETRQAPVHVAQLSNFEAGVHGLSHTALP